LRLSDVDDEEIDPTKCLATDIKKPAAELEVTGHPCVLKGGNSTPNWHYQNPTN
jgi:hypothetical protein